MPLRLSARVVGLDKALRDLREVPKRIRNRAIRQAFRQMGSTLSRDVKSQIPGRGVDRTGLTRKSIGFKIKLARVSGRIVLVVGPRTGFGQSVVLRSRGAQGRTITGRFTARPARIGRYHNPTRIFHILESGSRKFSGRGYLTKALARNRGRLPEVMRQHVSRALASHVNS